MAAKIQNNWQLTIHKVYTAEFVIHIDSNP